MQTDEMDLVRQFARSNSDEAFAALVRRHINLVYSVALRQLGNPHEAEEVNDVDVTDPSIPRGTTNSWVTGNCVVDTNPATITGGAIYPYVKNVQPYRCPTDHSVITGTSTPTLRSYSLKTSLRILQRTGGGHLQLGCRQGIRHPVTLTCNFSLYIITRVVLPW